MQLGSARLLTMLTRDKAMKLLILLAVGYAVVCMWHWKEGFTYFTQLSNLFAAAAVALQLWADARGGLVRHRAKTVKFAATAAIVVTGTVYLFVLAPVEPQGMAAAYAQDHYSSLVMHAVVPALMLVDFLVNDTDRHYGRLDVLLALVPPIGYLAFMLSLGAAGFRWHEMAAPYPFLNYEAPAGWFGFRPETADWSTTGIGAAYAIVALLVLFVLVASALLTAANRLGNRR